MVSNGDPETGFLPKQTCCIISSWFRLKHPCDSFFFFFSWGVFSFRSQLGVLARFCFILSRRVDACVHVRERKVYDVFMSDHWRKNWLLSCYLPLQQILSTPHKNVYLLRGKILSFFPCFQSLLTVTSWKTLNLCVLRIFVCMRATGCRPRRHSHLIVWLFHKKALFQFFSIFSVVETHLRFTYWSECLFFP